MCLIIDKLFSTREQAREFTKKPKIAKKDIVVYKNLYESFFSPYRDKIIYASPFRAFEYEEGMHYYQIGRKFSFRVTTAVLFPGFWKVYIHKGLHAYKEKQLEIGGISIIKMIVPKGSQYFDNKEEIVSDNLIFPHQ